MSEIKPPPLILSLAEGRVFGETARLLLTLPLLRLQARRGSAEPVIILPGFMADDRSTALLRAFVQSIGYSTSGWLLGTNRLPMMQYLPALRDQMMDLKAKFGGKVHLIGWSRGGMIARELARDYPELVKQVITIGTPVRGGLAASAMGRWVQRETGLSTEQMAQIIEERYRSPITVPVRAIYSKTDGVVAWKACIDDQNEDVVHYEIESSHVGMGSNVEVFRLIPKLLSKK